MLLPYALEDVSKVPVALHIYILIRISQIHIHNTRRSLALLAYPLEDVSKVPVASPREQLGLAVQLLQQVLSIL